MFSSFKNTELFRYYVRVDINNGIDKILKQNKSSFSLIAGSIFSGSFSILGTYFGMNTSEYKGAHSILISTTLYVILFIIGFILFQLGTLVVKYFSNGIKKEKLPSKQKIKEYIDDFDHIACDNILISQNFIKAYEDHATPINLKEFYFYEIIYYSKVSISIIQKLLSNQDRCINDKNNTNRVHLFRLENSIKMLIEINTFLNNNKLDIDVDTLMQPSLFNEISNLEAKLKKFEEDCKTMKSKKYSQNNSTV